MAGIAYLALEGVETAAGAATYVFEGAETAAGYVRGERLVETTYKAGTNTLFEGITGAFSAIGALPYQAAEALTSIPVIGYLLSGSRSLPKQEVRIIKPKEDVPITRSIEKAPSVPKPTPTTYRDTEWYKNYQRAQMLNKLPDTPKLPDAPQVPYGFSKTPWNTDNSTQPKEQHAEDAQHAAPGAEERKSPHVHTDAHPLVLFAPHEATQASDGSLSSGVLILVILSGIGFYAYSKHR